MFQYLAWVSVNMLLVFVLLVGSYFLLDPNANFKSDLIDKIGRYLNDSNIRDLDLASLVVDNSAITKPCSVNAFQKRNHA